MKNFLRIAAITGFVALSLSACPSTSPNSSNSTGPTASPGNGTIASTAPTGSGIFSSRTAYIAYLNCIKTNNPQLAGPMEVHFIALNALTDAQWPEAIPNYQNLSDNYSAFGCK